MLDATARHPRAALALAALLSLGAVIGITRIEPEVDFVDAVPDHDGLDAYRDLLERLDGVRFVAVYMADATGLGLRTPEAFDALIVQQEDLTAHLEGRFPGAFSHQLSAAEAMRAGHYMLEKIATGGNPRPEAYSIPDDPVRYQTVRDRTLDEPSLDDVLAQDGSSALMLFFFATDDNLDARRASGDVAEALALWRHDGTVDEVQASGLLYASHVTDERNAKDLRTWSLVAAGAVALSLLWVLRRPSAVLLAGLGMVVALAWSFGLVGLLGIRISFLTMFLAPVVAGIGIDAAVHLLHRCDEGRGGRDGVASAVRQAGPPVLLAGTTTAAGIAVLLVVPNPLFAQIGGVAALGILAALASAWLVVVPLRTWSAVAQRQPGRVPEVLARWSRRVHRRPGAVLTIVLVSLVAAGVGATQVRVESGSAENEFPQDDPVIRLQHRIEEEYGAFQRAYIIVRGDLTDPDAILALHEAKAAAARLPLFREAASVADLLLADEATDEGSRDILLGTAQDSTGSRPTDAQRLPQTASEARERLERLFEDPLWRTIVPFTITRELDLAVMAVTLDPWSDQRQLHDLRDGLDDLATFVQQRLPGHDVAAGGAPVNRAAVIDQTPDNVLIATLGTAGVVGVLLATGWSRHGRKGLAAAGLGLGIVLASALALLAAVAGLDALYARAGSGNSAALTDMFLLAFAITVAVGVDDLVHLIGRYMEAMRRGFTPGDAMEEAFRHAGRAITGTTLTTFVGFAALTGVYFLQSKNLAILTSVGVAVAYGLTMLVVPAVLGRGVFAVPVAKAQTRPPR